MHEFIKDSLFSYRLSNIYLKSLITRVNTFMLFNLINLCPFNEINLGQRSFKCKN